MRALPGWRRLASLWRVLFERREVEEDLDAEVRSYFEILADRAAAAGSPAAEARRAVRRGAEGPEQVKERVRDVRAGARLEAAWRDARYAARGLRKSPGYTALAVATLALGLGANGAIFSLIDALMLRLLPVAEPERLVLLSDPGASGVMTETREHGDRELFAYPEFEALRARTRSLAGLFAAQSAPSSVDLATGASGGAEGEVARVQLVSGEFFGVLGLAPAVGRLFAEADDAPAARAVAVISYGFWQRRYGGDPAAVGRTLRVGRARLAIAGVAPDGFRGIVVGTDTDVWVPMRLQAEALPGRDYLRPADTLWLQVMGRLAPGVSLAAATAETNVVFRQFLEERAALAPTAEERQALLDQRLVLRPGASGASALRGQFADPLLLLLAMVGVVLAIVCANLANLTLARATARRREIGVCMALGAGRGRLVRQLLAESLLIAGAGAALGLPLAALGTRVLLARVADGVGGVSLDVRYDGRVLLFTAGGALLAAFLFGLLPALQATGRDVNRALVATRGAAGGGRLRSARLLVGAQVALTLVLLVGGALFVRSARNLVHERLGIDRERLLTVRVDPAAAGYRGPQAFALHERVRSALAALPGAVAATVSDTGIFAGDSNDPISIDGVAGAPPVHPRWTEVGPDYFTTAGIALLRGRAIDEADFATGAPVCVVNETFVRQVFAGADPIGHHLTDEYPSTRETYEIVGVVADAKEHRPDEPARPRFYANLAHPIGTVGAVTFLVRSAADPATMALAARRAITAIDPALPIVAVRTATQQLTRRIAAERLVAELSSFFGVAALLLATLGLYGVLSYSISRRVAELGVRMAIGASRGRVTWMVLRETLLLVGAGIAVGLPCALVQGLWISSRLFGLAPWDPATLLAVTASIVVTALCAGLVPARRAARVDPITALRME